MQEGHPGEQTFVLFWAHWVNEISLFVPHRHLRLSSLPMADDEPTVAVRSAVRDVFASGKISTPISSMDLLLSLITSKATACTSHLRLTDLKRLEIVLEGLAGRWEHGSISLSRENGVLTITEVHFGNAPTDMMNLRKRKRPPVDEEADSAAGDDPDERSSRSISNSPPPASPLANLGKELREVYAILQRATAKGRLLAERVCGRSAVMEYHVKHLPSSSVHRMEASAPFAPISRRRTVPRRVERTQRVAPLNPSVIVYTSSR